MADPFGTEVKRGAFGLTGFWVAFHLVGVAILVFAGAPNCLLALLLFDGFGLLIAGLYWLAARIFPRDRGESDG